MRNKKSEITNQWKNGPVRKERCYEPVARCLIRTLMVPNIYFEQIWPMSDHSRVDIIAVDRAGTGDIHVVKVCSTLNEAITKGVENISKVSAHYRWVVFQGKGFLPYDEDAEFKLFSEEPLLPESGMGRIGVIEIVRMAKNDIGANIELKAERFQVKDISGLIKDFVEHTEADIEFKE